MFQLYRDGIEDLLMVLPKEKDMGGIKRKPKEHDAKVDPYNLKVTLAEHSPTGLVYVSFYFTSVEVISYLLLLDPIIIGGRCRGLFSRESR